MQKRDKNLHRHGENCECAGFCIFTDDQNKEQMHIVKGTEKNKDSRPAHPSRAAVRFIQMS